MKTRLNGLRCAALALALGTAAAAGAAPPAGGAGAWWQETWHQLSGWWTALWSDDAGKAGAPSEVIPNLDPNGGEADDADTLSHDETVEGAGNDVFPNLDPNG